MKIFIPEKVNIIINSLENKGFEAGGRALSQRMQVASRSWKRQGNLYSPWTSRRNSALLIIARENCVGFLTYRTVR